MPEGHTIKALANDWAQHVGERYEVSAPTNRVPYVSDVDGHELVAVDTKGKHLFLGFDNRLWLHIHLGRVGKFSWHAATSTVPAPGEHVRLRMVGERGWVDLTGPIVCEVLQPEQVELAKGKLGPDPLDPTADPDLARNRIQKSKRPIAALLMDQHVIAGIGNIYRAELLWRSRIDPYRSGTAIADADFAQLWADTVLLLSDGALEHRYGEPTNTVGRPLPDGTSPQPEGLAARGNHTQAYGRAGLPCARCGNPIVQAELSARTLYWCPVCQAA